MGYSGYGGYNSYGGYGEQSEPPVRTLKKGIYSKLIVLLVIMLNVGFTIYIVESMKVMLFEPAVLVGGWFTFTSVEVGACAYVKAKKTKTGGDTYAETDKRGAGRESVGVPANAGANSGEDSEPEDGAETDTTY